MGAGAESLPGLLAGHTQQAGTLHRRSRLDGYANRPQMTAIPRVEVLKSLLRRCQICHIHMLPNDRCLVNRKSTVLLSTGMRRKNPAAVALGKRKSAKKAASSARNAQKALDARMAQTPEHRATQARKAAQARWSRKKR